MALKFEQCSVCREYGWADSHRCQPEWEWRSDNNHLEDDWSSDRVHSYDAEGAALKAAEIYDQHDYELVRGSEVTIFVRRIGETEITKWHATAESVPKYYVSASEDED